MENKRIALVTGGMGSLGTAICQRLHRSGFTVAVTYSPAERTPAAWLSAQRDEGCRFSAYACDLREFDQAGAMIRQLLADHGRLDVLVNNAGIDSDATLAQLAPASWRDVMSSNLDSVFNVSKQAIEPMLGQQWGRIINFSALSSQAGTAAAGAGVHGFTKSAALELARDGITVNTVSPGRLNSKGDASLPAAMLQTIPVGRLGEPDEVAALVSYLCSDEAAFITGANLAINGGLHMS